jgi:hypothetical protein
MMQLHALKPVMISLMIILCEVQQNCEKAWRHLGFVPDLDKIVGVDKSTTSDPFHQDTTSEIIIFVWTTS